MNTSLFKKYKKVRKEHGCKASTSYSIAKSLLKTSDYGLDNYSYHYKKGAEIDASLPKGCSIVLKVQVEEYEGSPWERCEGWGTVSAVPRYSEYVGNGCVSLRSYGRDNYSYNFAEALAKARKDFSGTKFGKSYADQLALEAVQREKSFFEEYLNDDWHYVWVSVKAYRDGEEVYEESCGMYESTSWQEGAVGLIKGAERAIYASEYAGSTVGAL
jgi:hypothetical protein